jgi:hypothetical protein
MQLLRKLGVVLIFPEFLATNMIDSRSIASAVLGWLLSQAARQKLSCGFCFRISKVNLYGGRRCQRKNQLNRKLLR